jgi:hypothetical protein
VGQGISSVQLRVMVYGEDGNLGKAGNLESVTCEEARNASRLILGDQEVREEVNGINAKRAKIEEVFWACHPS